MGISLQKASVGKRIIAAIFDFICLSIIAVGLATLFSLSFGYDGYMHTVESTYERYETEYGVKFDITNQEYEKMSEEERKAYDTAYQALVADKDVIYAYNMLINLTILIITFSILIGVLAVEFVVPLLFRNGQTLGKKIFGIGVMHTAGIKVSALQLFVRAVLGKFALEIMIPLSIVIMIFFNSIGIVSVVVLFILLAVQGICLVSTRTWSLLHDVIAGTVAVDLASQRIFDTKEQLLEYTKARHAEQVAKDNTY